MVSIVLRRSFSRSETSRGPGSIAANLCSTHKTSKLYKKLQTLRKQYNNTASDHLETQGAKTFAAN